MSDEERQSAAFSPIVDRASHLAARMATRSQSGLTAAMSFRSSSRHYGARRRIEQWMGASRGGRSAAVALVAEVSAAGALASLPANTLPSLRSALGEALADGLGNESRALQLRLQQLADVGYADPHDALFARHALDLLIENGGRRTPSKTCRRAAIRNAASGHPSTARVERPRETACARFWRC